MKKLKSTLPNMILSLGVISVCAGAALGGMYSITKDKIAEQESEQRLSAIRQVAPAFTNNPVAESDTMDISGLRFVVYPAENNGQFVGAAVEGVTMSGFSGEISVMCGFDKEGKVLDYRVLRHAETPGLGSKMEEWFRDPTGARSVIGKNPSETNFSVAKDGGDIDGITAATYSSRAFLEVLRNAYEAYTREAAEKGVNLNKADNADATTGASKRHKEDNAAEGKKGKRGGKSRVNNAEGSSDDRPAGRFEPKGNFGKKGGDKK